MSFKALFCGLGSIGQRHLRNLRALLGDELEVMAYRSVGRSPVLNPDMSVRADANLESTYAIQSFTDLNAALDQKPDAVFVTNPNIFHLPVALAAARAGCHLFIEKPVSHSLDGLDTLIETVESRKLVGFVAYQFRFHPALRSLKSLIEQKVLGRLAAVHIVNGEYLPDWHPYEDYRETHPARRALGGGCLSIQTHEIDYAQWLFGVPRRIFAVGGQLSGLQVDVEDSVSMLLECDYEGRPLPVHIHLDYLQRPPQRICEIVGDEGRARYDYYANGLQISNTASGSIESHSFDDFDRNQMFIDELSHFLACVRGETEPLVGLRDGLQSLKVGLAASHSLLTGRSVEVLNV